MEGMISTCKEQATMALDWFLRSLSHVPADKVTWSPTPTAKSALQIAAHCAGFSGGFASVIRDRSFPPTVEAYLRPIESTIESIATVDQAETVLQKGIADTLAALDTVDSDQIGSIVDLPQ